jgi:hypothetical protein
VESNKRAESDKRAEANKRARTASGYAGSLA